MINKLIRPDISRKENNALNKRNTTARTSRSVARTDLSGSINLDLTDRRVLRNTPPPFPSPLRSG